MNRSTALSMITLVLLGSTAVAQDKPRSVKGPVITPGKDSGTVRLMYPGSSWAAVLSDLAEAGGYELVMPKKPAGRFERYDVRPISVAKALDVVNEKLAEQNLRVLPRGKFLIVLEDETFRPVYPRYDVTKRPSVEPAKPLATAENRNRSPEVISRVGHSSTPHPSTPHRESISPASFETPSEPAVEPLFPQLASAVEAEPSNARVIRPKRFRASELAKTVVASYGQAAELVDNGPMGLPAFRVSTLNDDRNPVRWAVGVDVETDRLVIDGPKEATEQLVNLFDRLDRRAPGQNVVLAAAPARVHAAATSMMPIVQSMLALQNEDPQPGALPNGQPVPTQNQDDITRILDRIRSNVSVESLDELGLLILRGNEGDVEAVMQIIDAIEKQSVGTTPEVHLRVLAHVDSSAMADLLNGVYEAVQSIETRPGRDDKRVSVISVVRPNAILIVAPSVELPSILDLVDNLDEPVDPATELRVYRLKYATASGAVATLTEFYEERGGLGTRVRVSADARTNSVIVQARPNDLAEVDSLLAKIDRADSGSVNRMQIFQLKNAVATELADFLNEAIESAIEPRQSGGGGRIGGGNQQENRSVVLEFLQTGEAAAELLRSGVLEDVRINADPRTNAIAVIAPERSIPLFAALIESLDVPSAAKVEVKVFTLANADASAAVELLDELFEQSGTDDPVGAQLSGTDDSASNLLPIRFSVDVRTNSIVATGGPDALTIVEAILIRLDSSDARQRTTQVIKLKNSPAEDVATAINDFLESQRSLAAANPDLVSTVELLNREVIVVPEVVSNNLLISATEDYYSDILTIVTELDAALAQVVVQALLVEVTLDNADEFGVELGFQDSVLFDRGLSTTTAVTSAGSQTVVNAVREPGFRFGDLQTFPNLGNVPVSPSTVGEQALSNFALGRVSDLGFGGLVLSASSEAVNVLVRALAQNREVRVLSRPQIRTVDGQVAQIQVGQSVPIINGITNTGNNGVVSPNIEYDESGLILDVTPRISPDGQIVMEVIAERSAYDLNNGVPVFVDASTGTTIQSPIKEITVARSTVSVSNGQTIVLGGLISERNESIARKVPYLGDIPILGRAFRYDQHSNLRTELLIFLTPRVIGGDQDNAVIKEVEAGRLHWFRNEAEAMHGPIFDVEHPLYDPSMQPHSQDRAWCPPEESGLYPSEVITPDELDQFVPMPTPAEATPLQNAPAQQPEVIR